MMVARVIAATVLITAGAAGPAAEPSGSALPSPESVSHIAELAWHARGVETSACTVICWDDNDYNMHVAVEGGDANEVGGGSHQEPYAGICADMHPECGVGFASADEIQESIDTNNIHALKAMLAGNMVYLASERNALQVIGCRGDVVAHFRVSSSMLTALAE